MDFVYYLCWPLGKLMEGCFLLVKNYGLVIILFTLITKLVLMPISVWIQKNSILMVKMQPEINFIKARLYGNADAIAEEQVKLFKREKYHPLLTLVPLVIQILLLLGVIAVIDRPLNYLFEVDPVVIDALAAHLNVDPEEQIVILQAIKSGTITSSTVIANVDPAVLADLAGKIADFDTMFLGLDLLVQPSTVWGWYTLVSVVAALSAWVMCFTQNLSNVIQHEQGNLNKYGMMALSVALSLVLGIFVATATALYWVASNLLSVAVMYLLNWLINPKKHVDYQALEESRKALAEARAFGAMDKSDPRYKQMRQKEKEDYKRFKKVGNKHIVVYSEKSGFVKYYKEILCELLKMCDVPIHYVTNDFNDAIFEWAQTEPRIKPYFISLKKTAVLMMLVETDIFIMTTPELGKYYLKRSFLKKDTEYIYVPHDAMSVHMGFKEGALDNFDTVFCSGPHVVEEVRATEQVYGLPAKNLVEFGFPLLDNLVDSFRKTQSQTSDGVRKVLIAPSWNDDNILDSCLDDIVAALLPTDVQLIVRPHPEYVKRYGGRLNGIMERYKDVPSEKLRFETDFSGNDSVYTSDLLITDWSGISAEFAFATGRPVLFVNTQMKVLNPNWQKIGLTPVEIQLRDIIGVNLDKDKLPSELAATVQRLFDERQRYTEQINACYERFIFNHGTAGRVGAKYILNSLIAKQNKRK